MTDQSTQVKEYKVLSQEEIDLMNECKELASKCGDLIEKLESLGSNDQRCVSLGKTKLQEGFMWAIRGFAEPTTF